MYVHCICLSLFQLTKDCSSIGKTERKVLELVSGWSWMEHVTVPCWFTAACLLSPTHHQDVTLASGRHMTAPAPSNGTGHLAIRPHHQHIVYDIRQGVYLAI